MNFTNTSTNGPFSNVSWTFEGGNPSTSTSNNPQVCYQNDGVYTVNLIVDNAAGSGIQNSPGYITVSNNQFTISISPSGPVSLCEGESITLIADNGLSNYEWSNGQNSQQVEITETGGYSVSAENATGCIGVSNVVNVNVTPIPIAAFTYLQTFPEYLVEFTNTSSGNGTYVWSFPGGSSSTLENPEFQFAFDNNWPVNLIASNSCGVDTLNTIVNVIKTGINDIVFSEGYAFLNEGKVYFITDNFSGINANINFYNSIGQKISHSSLDLKNGTLNSMDIPQLNVGIYYLMIISDGKIWVKKVLKV